MKLLLSMLLLIAGACAGADMLSIQDGSALKLKGGEVVMCGTNARTYWTDTNNPLFVIKMSYDQAGNRIIDQTGNGCHASNVLGNCTRATSFEYQYQLYGPWPNYDASPNAFYYFNDVNGYLTITNRPAFTNHEAFTVMARIFATAGSYVFAKGAANDWYARYNGGELQAILHSSSGNLARNSNIATGKWLHVTLVYTGGVEQSAFILFTNAVYSSASSSFTGFTSPRYHSTSAINIGAQDGAGHFGGWIDDVRYYPYALSYQAITNIVENSWTNELTLTNSP